MASSKLLMASIAVALLIYSVGAGSDIEELRSRISALESSISDRVQDIKKKDQSILNFENVITEKLASIFFLQSDIELLRKQAAADAEQAVEKVLKQASEMEKQVSRLKSEIEAQTMKRGALEGRGAEAEKKAQELNLKLENVHEAWLPPWLALHMSYCVEIAATHWNKHGKPALDGLFQKASEKSSLVQKWAEPHLHTTRTKWIPAAKEQTMSFVSIVQPYAVLASAKTMEVYETSKKIISTHIMKARELADPYFLEARKFPKPYVDQIANVAKPHFERLQVILDPYHKLAVHSYKKLAKTTLSYHNQGEAKLQRSSREASAEF